MTTQTPPVACPVPFTPRALTPRERSHADLFVFRSPKLRRRVMVTRTTDLYCSLELEFDPSVVEYVERPRSFLITRDSSIECSFWLRREDGKECFLLTAPPQATRAIAGDRVKRVDQEAIDQAARSHGLSLKHCFDRDYARRGAEIQSYLRLLPAVQESTRLVTRTMLRERIRELFTVTGTSSFLACEAALSDVASTKLGAVLAWMIHTGEVTWRRSVPLDRSTPLNWRERHVDP